MTDCKTDTPDLFGPCLPPELVAEDNTAQCFVGPIIPVGPRESEECDSYGPALPPDMVKSKIYGPTMPHHVDDDDDYVGPVPDNDEDEETYERRIEQFKIKMAMEDAAKSKRESWMTELPDNLRKNFGLGARTFSKKGVERGDEDKSSWTESPLEKELKGPGFSKKPKKQKIASDRDKRLEEKAQQFNKGRTESMLDSHQRKRKVDTEDEIGPTERVTFDRDRDLDTKRISKVGVKEVAERATQLHSRFGHSDEQKYL